MGMIGVKPSRGCRLAPNIDVLSLEASHGGVLLSRSKAITSPVCKTWLGNSDTALQESFCVGQPLLYISYFFSMLAHTF